MHRLLVPLTSVVAFAGLALHAQAVPVSPEPLHVASLESLPVVGAPVSLPDAPSSSSLAGEITLDEQAGVASPHTAVAPKYSGIILEGQTAPRLTGGEKVVYGFRDAFSLFSLVGATASAGYEQVVDSQPHYGPGATGFGKREGAAALRSTVESLATDAVFSPLFHDDPRYYALGIGHSFLHRFVYAGTRVLVTRTDAGRHTVNAPLLLGYGVASGLNNLYYPDQDTGFKSTLTGFGGSIGGAALGMEVNEFIDDALHIVHLRK